MAISIVAGTAVATNTSSTSISKPTGTQQNDLILVMCESSTTTSNAVPTAPSGFTNLATLYTAGQSGSTWAYKVAGASEPSSWTFTGASGTTFDTWACIVVRGQDGTTPIDAGGNTAGGSNVGTLTISALTASVANDMLIIMVNDGNDVDVSSWPSGVTENASASNAAGNGVMTGTKASLASGSTGSLSLTFSGTQGVTQGCAFLVKAPSGGGGTAWNQSVSDSHSALEARFKQPQKRLTETFSELDLKSLTTGKNLTDAHSGLDVKTLQVLKALIEFHSGLDSRTNQPSKNPSDTHSALDTLLPKSVTKVLSDAFSELDLLSKMPAKTFIEKFSELDSVTTQKFSGVIWNRLVTESHSALDVVARVFTKLNADAWSAIDAVSRTWVAHLLIQEFMSETDQVLKQVTHSLSDVGSSIDSHSLQPIKNLLEATSAQDLLQRAIQKVSLDTTSGLDTPIKQVTHGVFDAFSETERVTIARGILLKVLDALSLTDAVVKLQDLRPGIRFALDVTTSLVASALGITITMTTAGNLSLVPSLLPPRVTTIPSLLASPLTASPTLTSATLTSLPQLLDD